MREQFDVDDKMKVFNNNLNSKFTGWVRLEGLSLFFSMASLILAIVDYEVALANGGFHGISTLTGYDKDADWDQILSIRLNVDGTNRLRILVAITSFLAIFFLTLRNLGQGAWKNNFYHKQLQRENL